MGIVMDADGINWDAWYEPLSLKNISRTWDLQVRGICHVGAHKATEAEVYKAVFGDIPITFIEANKNLEPYIKDSINGHENVDYKIVAAGSSFCEAVIHLDTYESATGESSSLLKPKKHLRAHPETTFHKPRPVKVEPLDHIMKGKSFNFLNMDVQGYELEVLRGATEAMKGVEYILIEVNRDELYEGCVMIDELDSFLHNFKRVHTEWSPRQDWGDALYIRTDLIDV